MRKILIVMAVVACLMAALSGCMPNQPAPAPTATPEVILTPTAAIEPTPAPAPLAPEETLVPVPTLVPDESVMAQ